MNIMSETLRDKMLNQHTISKPQTEKIREYCTTYIWIYSRNISIDVISQTDKGNTSLPCLLDLSAAFDHIVLHIGIPVHGAPCNAKSAKVHNLKIPISA